MKAADFYAQRCFHLWVQKISYKPRQKLNPGKPLFQRVSGEILLNLLPKKDLIQEDLLLRKICCFSMSSIVFKLPT